MHTFFLLLWGTCTLASIIGAIIVVVLHNRHLRQDRQLRDEGIYITRVPRREALISLLTPTLPAGFFAFYLYTQAELGILFNLLMFILLLVFLYHLLHVHLVYTKITPDTVEQKLSPFATVTPTRLGLSTRFSTSKVRRRRRIGMGKRPTAPPSTPRKASKSPS